MNAPRPPLLQLDEALAQLLGRIEPLEGQEMVATLEADGRFLASPLHSALQVPAFDNSSMDGYAVRSQDLALGPVDLRVSQRIPAGTVGQGLHQGEAARIFTGAPVPEGADAIVMQEDAQWLDDGTALGQVRVSGPVVPGQWIRRRGEDVALGSMVLPAGTRLGPAELGLAASLGMAQLPVARAPRVALFSTGDELVMPGEVAPEALRAGAIFNSNRFFLKALLHRLGCEVSDLGIVPDSRQATLAALRTAADHHDLILTSGGVSVGEEDHVKPAVQALGELALWQIAMKPGKPFAYGQVRRTTQSGQAHFVGLPGNPVSSYVTCLLMVRPLLLRLQGAVAAPWPRMTLRADFAWPRPDKRREFLRVRRNARGGLDLFPNQSSGVLTSLVWADGLVDNPSRQAIEPGDWVTYIPLSEAIF